MNMMQSGRLRIPVLGIIGVGMIGGSLSLALKKRGRVDRVLGFGRSRENLDQGLELGAIDAIASSVEELAEQSDLIVVATPVGAMQSIFSAMQPLLNKQKVVTDVGSVKVGVVDQARAGLGAQLERFVPAHPVAGRELSGVGAATADLYSKHIVATTPLDSTALDALTVVEEMWKQTGAILVRMEVEEHDRVLGLTSHLPHILAYAMVHYFAESDDLEKCYQMTGGGFYDLTRIASSDPVMWRDICQLNKTELLKHIGGFENVLSELKTLLESGDDQQIEDLFAAAKQARARVTEKRKAQQTDQERLMQRRVQQLVNR